MANSSLPDGFKYECILRRCAPFQLQNIKLYRIHLHNVETNSLIGGSSQIKFSGLLSGKQLDQATVTLPPPPPPPKFRQCIFYKQ